MVRPVGDSADPDTIVPNKREGLYCATENFVKFFEKAFGDYTTIKAYEDNAPANDKKLYLTYNDTNYLGITLTKPENDIYIEIAYNELFDESFFAADIVSRIQETKKAEDAIVLANWLTKYTKAEKLTPEKTATLTREKEEDDNKIEMTDVVYGYYLIVTTFEDKDADNDGTVINKSILDVPKEDTITLKASPITITKTVTNETDKTASASIGDTLTYTVKSKIMDLSNYDLKTYTHTLDKDVLSIENINNDVMKIIDEKPTKFHYLFSDTMFYQKLNIESISIDIKGTTYQPYFVKSGEGEEEKVEYYFIVDDKKGSLTLDDDNDGTRDVNTVATDDMATLRDNAFARLSVAPYTDSTPNSQFFAINFDLKALKEQKLDPNDIKINYNTWITVGASNDGITNGASLNYSHNPYDPADASKIKTDDPTGDDQTHVYTYDFLLNKQFSDNSTNNFDKLYFKLYSDSDCKNEIEFVKPKTKDDENNKLGLFYYVKADNETADNNKTAKLELGADGQLRIHGLGEGTYYLKEIYEDLGDNSLDKKGYKPITTATITITPYYTNVLDEEGNQVVDESGNDVIIRDTELKLWGTATGGGTSIFTPSVVLIDSVEIPLKNNNNYCIEFSVLNQKGFTLPITGENGNWAFAIIGIMLVTGGAVLIFFLFRKKKES